MASSAYGRVRNSTVDLGDEEDQGSDRSIEMSSLEYDLESPAGHQPISSGW